MNREDARQILLDHAREPLRRVRLLHADRLGECRNPVCGDHVVIRLRVLSGKIEALGVESAGCTMCVASGSLLGEAIEGRGEEEARLLARGFELALLGDSQEWPESLSGLEALAPLRENKTRLACALLPWQALARALNI